MEIYTLNVSQGQFAVVVGKSEAFVVDTFVPLSSQQDTVFVKARRSVKVLVKGADGINAVSPFLLLDAPLVPWIGGEVRTPQAASRNAVSTPTGHFSDVQQAAVDPNRTLDAARGESALVTADVLQ